MIVIIGAILVTVSVLGGFMLAGGHLAVLWQLSEVIVICGSALGALIIMSPKKVLLDMVKQIIGTLKGTPRVVSQTGINDSNRPQASLHAERAIRAVQLAAPFNLPTQFYSRWRRLQWTFDRRL